MLPLKTKIALGVALLLLVLAFVDAQGALTWLGNLTDPALRDVVLPNVIAVVAESDPREAAKLFSRLSTTDAQATATAAIAWQWAESIGDQTIRDRQVESIATTWLRIDASSATAWVTHSSLPPETKARLLAQNR